jgi:Effector-associated domain 11
MINLDLKHELDLLLIHQQALAILEKKIAIFGDFVPTYMLSDYDHRLAECKTKIELIAKEIEKEYPEDSLLLKENIKQFTYVKLSSSLVVLQKLIIQKEIERQPQSNFTVKVDSTLEDAIRQKITKGQTDEALSLLIQLCRNTDRYSDTLLLSARFRMNERFQLQGIIKHEDYSVESHKINHAILATLDELAI